MKENVVLPVIFRLEGKENAVVAFFPTEPGTLTTCTCYAHLGQHASASQEYYATATKPATAEQYLSLLDELRYMCDDDDDGEVSYTLKPVRRWIRAYDVVRCRALDTIK